jgi:hypothetical protein
MALLLSMYHNVNYKGTKGAEQFGFTGRYREPKRGNIQAHQQNIPRMQKVYQKWKKN